MTTIPERELIVGLGWRKPGAKPEPVLCVYVGACVEECQAALLNAIDSNVIFYGRTFRGWSSTPFAAFSKTNRPPAGPAEVLPPERAR